MSRQAEGKPSGTDGAPDQEQVYPSTRWASRMVKISTAPKALQDSRRRRPSGGWVHPKRGEPVTLTITYRAGPQAWFTVRARGRTWQVPGVLALYDVVVKVLSES